MDRSLPLLIIGLVFGGGIGFTVAAANGITLGGHDHADPAHHGNHALADTAGSHDHSTLLSMAADASAPSLAVHAMRDPASGWNLHVITENFTFSPQNASRDHVPGEGHAHVYINGVKLGRFYGLKWSQKTGQLAKVYPERLKGYENGEAPEFYRPV